MIKCRLRIMALNITLFTGYSLNYRLFQGALQALNNVSDHWAGSPHSQSPAPVANVLFQPMSLPQFPRLRDLSQSRVP